MSVCCRGSSSGVSLGSFTMAFGIGSPFDFAYCAFLLVINPSQNVSFLLALALVRAAAIGPGTVARGISLLPWRDRSRSKP